MAKSRSTYPSDEIRGVLEKTLGVPLFQEQAMRLAIVAAGFTPGEADQLRRAMGAWRRPGLIDHFHQRLIEGMRARGLPPEYRRGGVSADPRFRRLWISRIARRQFRTAGLCLRLVEMPPPGCFHGRTVEQPTILL